MVLTNTIHPLCYEHHTEMTCVERASKKESLAYRCQEPDCHVYYDRSEGYFLNGLGRNRIEQETTPRVHCSQDGHLIYLLEVQREHPSFRLWRCPQCKMSHVGGSLPKHLSPPPESGRRGPA